MLDGCADSQIEAIEEEIDLGQIEEVIEMCKNELEVIDMYHGKVALRVLTIEKPSAHFAGLHGCAFAANKVWEIVDREKEYIQQHIQEIKDSLYYTDPTAQEPAGGPTPGNPPK